MINKSYIEPFEIILGSGSPRRSEILSVANIPFFKKVYPISEDFPSNMEVDKVPIYLAEQKAAAHHGKTTENQIVLTADSVVILDGIILGKPIDTANAKHILSMLSGKTHTVVTGVCLYNTHLQRSFADHTTVSFSEVSENEIDYYVDTFLPLDKAGAYGIQDWIGHNKVQSIQGSYLNVKGLPMEKLYRELGKFIEKLRSI